MTLLNQALALSTPDAYNPFCGPGCNDESSFLIDIVRGNTTQLYMFDFKMSNPNVYDMPAGPVGMLIGTEVRKERYTDDRDPRINGEQRYTVPVGVNQGLTFPLISDVVNSSATPDSQGSRTTASLFTEFQIPLTENIDMQYAVRAEDSSDYGSNVVRKLALGWQILDQVKFRYSNNETFRAPAMILVNEGFLGRSSSTTDHLLEYAAQDTTRDAYSMQRVTEGNPGLLPEEGDNESIGFVFTPVDGLTITVDKWSIETENTIGIFGMTNAILLDTLIRAEGGPSECVGNPNVVRYEYKNHGFDWPSNLCPAGEVQKVNDFYVNTDTRTIEGKDTSVMYNVDTDFGRFGFKVMHVHYDVFNQAAGGDARLLSDAGQPGGILAGVAPVRGIDNLLNLNGRIDDKYTMKMSYRNGPYEVLVSGTQWGSFFESAHTETIDGVRQMWPVDEMTVFNVTLGYKFKNDLRVRLQVKNIEDERAPLADETFGMYWGDLHTDFGKNYNVEFYKKF
jgi:iron complex outermembrane receptor protein